MEKIIYLLIILFQYSFDGAIKCKLRNVTFDHLTLLASGGLRGPDGIIISCLSKTPQSTTVKLADFYLLSIRQILGEFQQNRSAREVATADF